MGPVRESNLSLYLLSELLLAAAGSPGLDLPGTPSRQSISYPSRTYDLVARLHQTDLEDLKSLARTNHVVVRAFEPLRSIFDECGKPELATWADGVLKEEKKRIGHALQFLEQICSALE